MDFNDLNLPAGMSGHLDHIGIAVTDLDEAIGLYSGLLGLELLGTEDIPREKIRVAMLRLDTAGSNCKLELLEPLAEDSNIGRFITKKGPGLHHVAFHAQDMEQALENCRLAELQLLNETPLPGAHGKQVVFLHPKSTCGVLVEICSG